MSVNADYFDLLQQVIFTANPENNEAPLLAAFNLGRTLVRREMPPEELAQIHHEAIVRLSDSYPELKLADVANRLTAVFIEMSVAYGIDFRNQLEKRYEAQFNARLEQSRMEAVGAMAAGIAHDFNNILASIVGYAEMAGDDIKEGSAGKACLQQVLVAAFRARDIVSRMLTFSRKKNCCPEEVEILSQIRESLELLRVSLRPDVTISLEESVGLAMVLADAGQLQQIVMNLCINAMDAIKRQGAIKIKVEKCRLALPEQLSDKPAVSISVQDDGHGIPPDKLEQIFLPFFTTKPPNEGSGLGLSVVYGIVNAMGGQISVTSSTDAVNHGTEFKIVLPLIDHSSGVDGQN